MEFLQILARVASSVDSRNNLLTDSSFRCTYQELPAILEHVEQYFHQQDIQANTCFFFECPHSLLGAVTLIYLLSKKHDFVLVPPPDGKKREIESPNPHFCQYHITVTKPSIPSDRDNWHISPQSFLRIEPNPHFLPARAHEGKESALYLRTSGSMGDSKLAMHLQAKFLGNARGCVTKYKLASDDRIAIPVPIFHLYGLGAAFIPGIFAGASLDLQENANLLRYMDRERQFDPNVAFLTPALCAMRLQGRGGPRAHKVVVTAGDKINEELFREFDSRFGPLVNQYGSTEMGAVAACDPDDPIELRARTIGKPLSGVELRVNAQGDDPSLGELQCKPAYGFERYVDNRGTYLDQAPEWFQTRDLARLHPGGYVQVLGRMDNSVKRSGKLVMLAEIEKAMESLPGVAHAVVVPGSGEGKRGRLITAYCVPAPGQELSSAQARKLCFEILPQFAVPDSVFVVGSLPMLPNGKIDRQALVGMASTNRNDNDDEPSHDATNH